MEAKDKKILFFDIDGTLLTPPPFSIPESTVKGLKKAQEQGHLTFINSGRTRFLIPENIRALGFDGYVCGCGSQIYLHDELIFEQTIPHDVCEETVRCLRDCKIAALFERPIDLLTDGASPAQSALANDFVGRVPMKDLSVFDEKSTYTFDKFLIELFDDSDKEAFWKFSEDKYLLFQHRDNIYEVTRKDTSKATGIQFLLDYFHLPLENSYAFGDSNNDLPMLKYAGNSIAMGNAMKEILPFCTYQTTDITDDGIYNALKHFGLIG